MTQEQVFLAALDLPDRLNRTAYLNEACGQNSELRRQVEELLAAHERSGQFLDQPAAEQMAAGPQSPKDETLALNAEGDDAMADKKKTNPSPSDDDADDLHFLSPTTRPDSLGRLGHYEMLQVLGRGGFGIVFRAFDDVLQRVVAVKVMAPQIATVSPARKRFLREAQSSAKVRHEHVVQIYEVGEQPLPYLVMEFIPGETLQQKLDRSGPLDVPEVLRIGRQIAEGLAAAHACDLIHRDIKPGNILLEGGSHKAKITDFGLARAADDASISQSGIIAGTPMFMAPEQALGHKIDQRADLFSLGSVLYQMASGRPPFRAPSALAVLKRVAEEPPRPIPEIIPETPDWLCGIIAKLHAKNPEDRFQSAREVADLLADCEAKLKAKQEVKNIIPAPAVKPAAPTASTGRKWQWAAAALALVLLLGGVWFGRAAMLYLSDRGELELVPQEGLMSVIVLQNDEGVIDGNKLHAPVTDWLDMKKSHTLKLPPGRYQLNVGTWPAGTHMSQWEVATSGPFGSNRVTVPVINTSAIVTVERGHRVTLRAVMRSEPPGAKQEPPPLVADWVPLFNGTDLAGWKTNENDKWRVENGVLIGSARGHLFADQKYQDFRCRITAKYNADAGGSLAFRGVGKNGEALAHGEVLIGNQSPEKTGSAHLWYKPKPEGVAKWDRELVPPDTWFELELIVRGKNVVAKVNGTTTADITLDRLPERGLISLNAYGPGTVLKFKKIEIKELPADPSQSPPLAVAPFDAAKAKELQELWAKHLGAPVEVTNSLGMRLRLIPPGEFTMGSDPAEVDRLLTRTAEFKDAPAWVQDQVRSEGPDRRVTMREPFYLGAHEVTVGQFREFVNATGYRTDAEKAGGFVWNNDIKNWERRPEYVWSNSTYAASETHPVVFLTLTDARAFCAWLGEKEDRRYAIPTEEQWEYACRAGTTARWFFGDDEARMKEFGWTISHSNGPNQPVGRLGANPFGLFDVHGNAIELTVTPQGRTVERGGDAGVAALRSRSASRHVVAKQDETTFRCGFRVAVVGDLSLARVPAGAASPEAKMLPVAVGPFTDADVKRIAALPAAEQVEEVRKELMRRNPGFDGKMEHKIKDGVVTELRIVTDKVADIAPIRVWSALRVLECRGTWTKPNGLLADLTPLEGMNLAALWHLNLRNTKVKNAGMVCFKDCKNLTVLELSGTAVSDVGLIYFKDCKNLTYLNLGRTQVSDAGLIPFKDCTKLTGLHLWDMPKVGDAGLIHFKDCKNLTNLNFAQTRLSDTGLANFKGMRLTHLYIDNTGVTDLNPLQGMPLEEIYLTPKNITRGLDILRDMKSLKTIGIAHNQSWPAAEFWERYDKGEFAK